MDKIAQGVKTNVKKEHLPKVNKFIVNLEALNNLFKIEYSPKKLHLPAQELNTTFNIEYNSLKEKLDEIKKFFKEFTNEKVSNITGSTLNQCYTKTVFLKQKYPNEYKKIEKIFEELKKIGTNCRGQSGGIHRKTRKYRKTKSRKARKSRRKTPRKTPRKNQKNKTKKN